MRKFICIIAAVLFVACSDDEMASYHALQRIAGPIDCIESVGCSWDDGSVHFSTWSNEYNNFFTFEIKEEGELFFYYKLNGWTYKGYDQNGWLSVKINGSEVFSKSDAMSKFKKASLGKVTKGSIIKVYGSSCDVKDIMIAEDIEGGNSNPQWDF